MKPYESLLKEAYQKVRVVKTGSERFEVPKVSGTISGKSTIITNIHSIAAYLRRDVSHLAKFLQREMAAPIKLEKDRIIFNTKLNSNKVNEKVQSYVREFVICPECGKPDTNIISEKGIKFKHCEACGAKSPVRQA